MARDSCREVASSFTFHPVRDAAGNVLGAAGYGELHLRRLKPHQAAPAAMGDAARLATQGENAAAPERGRRWLAPEACRQPSRVLAQKGFALRKGGARRKGNHRQACCGIEAQDQPPRPGITLHRNGDFTAGYIHGKALRPALQGESHGRIVMSSGFAANKKAGPCGPAWFQHC
jgi:hypothetical protein